MVWILCFGFEAISHSSCHLTSIVEKTHYGLVIVPFSAQLLQHFCSFFSYVGGVLVTSLFHCYSLIYFGYSANYSTRGAFVIIFWICSDLLNCLRNVGTIVITREIGWSSLKVIFTKQALTKATIFRCFDVFSVWPPQTFQVQAKISIIRPVFPDYLSVCYEIWFKWFHFHWKILILHVKARYLYNNKIFI